MTLQVRNANHHFKKPFLYTSLNQHSLKGFINLKKKMNLSLFPSFPTLFSLHNHQSNRIISRLFVLNQNFSSYSKEKQEIIQELNQKIFIFLNKYEIKRENEISLLAFIEGIRDCKKDIEIFESFNQEIFTLFQLITSSNISIITTTSPLSTTTTTTLTTTNSLNSSMNSPSSITPSTTSSSSLLPVNIQQQYFEDSDDIEKDFIDIKNKIIELNLNSHSYKKEISLLFRYASDDFIFLVTFLPLF